MKTKLSLAIALLVALSPSLRAADGLTFSTKALGSPTAEQRALAVDAGDFITTPGGPRKLLRWSGAVAVSTDEAAQETVIGAATAKGGALEGYAPLEKIGTKLAILKDTAADQPRKSSAALGEKLTSARRSAGVRSANPVFIDPTTGLWRIVTTDIIVQLKPGVSAPDYFGASWNRVRPLRGSAAHFILTLPTTDAEAVLAESRRHAGDARVAACEPDFLEQSMPQAIPNDALFANMWHLRNTGQSGGVTNADVRATSAWDITTGSPSIIVAIIDDGVQTTHPDLAPNLAINTLEVPGNGVDDDNNGYVDDVNGWNTFADSNNPNPASQYDKHGTACAGIAVARGNNSIGVAGVAHSSRVLPLKYGNANAGGGISSFLSARMEAVYYAAGRTRDGQGRWRGADVISMSIGAAPSSLFDDTLAWAAVHGRGGKGCPIFVSSGNGASAWQGRGITLPSGTFTITFNYRKNGSGSAGDDAAWLGETIFPNGSRERFDGAAFPPAGWTTGGDAHWTRNSESARSLGVSRHSARSGAIGHSQVSSLQTTVTGPGDFTYYYWVSSEAGADMLEAVVSQSGNTLGGATNSGVPALEVEVSYPASNTNAISVGASTDFDLRAPYSQYGTNLDLVAPSGGGLGAIYTTDRTGADGANGTDYDSSFSGTSASCPLAAGVGALVLSVNTNLTASQVRAILRGTADQIGGVSYTNGLNPYYGYGRVNAYQAVLAARGTVNDSCSGAIALVAGIVQTQTTAFVDSALDHPVSCGGVGGRDVWFKAVLPLPGLLFATTEGSDFDTVLSTYSGSCGALTGLVCQDDVAPGLRWSSNAVVAVPGTYYFQASGFLGASGNLKLVANLDPTVLPSGIVTLSNVSARSAVLRANVTPSHSTAMVWFEYGPDTSYGFRTPAIIRADAAPFTVSQPILGLTPGAIYYARVVVSNVVGTVASAHQIFSASSDYSTLDVSTTSDLVIGTSGNSPAGQTPPFATDNTATTKYLNFDKLNSGLTIVPSGLREVRALTLISAEDFPDRDPSSFVLEGSMDGVNFTRITSNAVPAFPTRHFIQSFAVPGTNVFAAYRVLFPTVSNAPAANSMQIAEVELLPYGEITSASDTVSITLPGGAQDVRGVQALFDRQLDDTNKLEVAPIAGGNTIVNIVPAAGASVLKGFELIGAADDFTYPQRRPSFVGVAGSNDGTNYTLIATASPIAPSSNLQLQEFSTLNNSNAYARYRVTFGPPVSGDRIQLGEMRLFGEAAPVPPVLAVRASGGNVLISWANNPGFTLETKADFNLPGWTTVTNAPVFSNGVNTVTLPLDGPAGFFRLRK